MIMLSWPVGGIPFPVLQVKACVGRDQELDQRGLAKHAGDHQRSVQGVT